MNKFQIADKRYERSRSNFVQNLMAILRDDSFVPVPQRLLRSALLYSEDSFLYPRLAVPPDNYFPISFVEILRVYTEFPVVIPASCLHCSTGRKGWIAIHRFTRSKVSSSEQFCRGRPFCSVVKIRSIHNLLLVDIYIYISLFSLIDKIYIYSWCTIDKLYFRIRVYARTQDQPGFVFEK